MLRYSYYPFKNSLEKVDGSDLILLKEVAEGWYIDYKVQKLKIEAYAKHLSAFANQYGGWLIIGVRENNDGSRTAAEFPGIYKDDIEKISRDLREAAAAHVNPEVLYEENIIDGPIDEIALEDERSIIIVGIPRSVNTPHIHSSGRIYRRLADQSKPKEETDRYILDDLWKRGNENQKTITKFLTQTPGLPERQSGTPWVYVYYKPSEGQLPPENILAFEEFVRIVTNTDDNILGVQVPMQAVHTTPNGYVARQIKGNDPSLASLSINWWHDGTVRLDVPLNTYNFSNFLETHENNKYAKQYCSLAHDSGYQEIKIVDYSIFTQVVASLTNYYLYMLNSIEDKRDIYSCFTIKNVFYTSPYVDSDDFIKRIKKFSLPLTMEKNIVIPGEPTEDTMFFHSAKWRSGDYADHDEQLKRQFQFSSPVVYRILNSVGLFSDVDTFASDIESWGFEKVHNVTDE